MIILGLTGGMDRLHQTSFGLFNKDIHDSAAVLLEDGAVVAAVEEERLDRIKHSNKFPARAARLCLERRGIRLGDVDRIAVVNTEETMARYVTWLHFVLLQNEEYRSGFDWVRTQLGAELGEEVPEQKIVHVGHHLAHAMSAFGMSGFERSLLVTLDGAGDNESGTVRLADRKEGLRLLREFSVSQSLGVFYQRMSFYLGFDAFSEFKVMGLAPYGDPSRFRRYFEAAYEIEPNGGYRLDFAKMYPLLDVVKPRKPKQPFEQQHKDIAASLQEMIEKIAFSVLHYYRRQTQQANLTLSGGVAHNCTLNGKILRSGLFERVFIQPAAHDAGTALGAALWAHAAEVKEYGSRRALTDVFWGADIDSVQSVQRTLGQWSDFLSSDEAANEDQLCQLVAERIDSGQVVGWVQGRSEFGPRALGHRSILADPRPAENKELINAMIKKREGFRPFAPAVLEEDLHEYFDVPAGVADLSFMTYVVNVKEHQRARLGAITHVDGTARVQTVSRSTNPLLWKLIRAFKERSSVPMLLNTSFNNNAEPIVDSVHDAIGCFLTTDLHCLVVRSALISKKQAHRSAWKALCVTLAGWAELRHSRAINEHGVSHDSFSLEHQRSVPAAWRDLREPIDEACHAVLRHADGKTLLGALLARAGVRDDEQVEAVVNTLRRLWARRYLSLHPLESEGINVARPRRAVAARAASFAAAEARAV